MEQTEDSALRAGVLSEDGNYVAAGYLDSKGDGNYDFCLLKVDPNGNMVWNKTYGGAESEKAYSMAKAPDGYVLVGEIDSPATSTDAWVLKVDEEGNSVMEQNCWWKTKPIPPHTLLQPKMAVTWLQVSLSLLERETGIFGCLK